MAASRVATVSTFACGRWNAQNIQSILLSSWWSLTRGIPIQASQRCLQTSAASQNVPVASVGGCRLRSTSGRPVWTCQPRHSSFPKSDGALSAICTRLNSLNLESSLGSARPLTSLALSRPLTGTLYPLSTAPAVVSTNPVLTQQPHRTVVRFSRGKGKKKTTRAVVDRFLRLANGLWVRTQAGRAKKLWKKSRRRRQRLKQHVFCNKTQSKMLDRMVCGYWKKRRYFVDDPYEKYQERNFNGYKMYLPQGKTKPGRPPPSVKF
ncbi:uncharacterized protein [Diadema antillarum]|uniref:uncharacterized protein n=1 Tax=Diadema antillarum TaxID=105358 RepID=UPI003A877C75